MLAVVFEVTWPIRLHFLTSRSVSILTFCP